MGNKVKITPIQANVIESIKKKFSAHEEDIIREHVHGHTGWSDKLIGLRDMPLLTLIDALRVGYVVKSEFATGDIVKRINGAVFQSESYHGEVIIFNNTQVFIKDHGWFDNGQLMIATPEECVIEKERMMWFDIETGDVLIHKTSRKLCRFIDQDSLDKIMIQVSWDAGAVAFSPRSNFELYAKKERAIK